MTFWKQRILNENGRKQNIHKKLGSRWRRAFHHASGMKSLDFILKQQEAFERAVKVGI